MHRQFYTDTVRPVKPGVNDLWVWRPPALNDRFYMHRQFYTDTGRPGSKDHLALTTVFACTVVPWGGRLNQVLLYTRTSLIRAPWDRALPVSQICPYLRAAHLIMYHIIFLMKFLWQLLLVFRINKNPLMEMCGLHRLTVTNEHLRIRKKFKNPKSKQLCHRISS